MADLHRTHGEAIEGKPRPLPPLGTPGAGGGERAGLSPVDALSLEHGLIRSVLRAMGGVANRIADDAAIDPFRLLRIIDFAETYAHRVHHGKEEEILFRELHAKDLESEHRQMMEVLAREHVEMRAFVHDLVEALEAYRGGDRERLSAIREALNGLIEIYPGHLEREEAEFFPTVEDYLDEDEMRVLMEAMAGHDRGVLHERYGRLVEALTGRAEDWELQE